nr:hypothetical protein [Gemmatimonadota bacterium]
DPDCALSDGAQSLFPRQFDEMMTQIRVIAEAIGREITPALVEREGAAAHVA